MMATLLLKLGLSGYDVKPRFCASQLNSNISDKIHLFFEENILVALDTYANKNEPTIYWGGCTVSPAGS